MPGSSSKKVSIFKKIYNKFRHGMILEAIRYRLKLIGLEFTPYYCLKDIFPSDAIAEVECVLDKFSIEFFGIEEMKVIGKNIRAYSEDDLLSRLKNGKKCLGMKCNDKIVAFMWIDLDECNHKPEKFCLNKNEAYTYDLYTLEPYRGKKIAPCLEYQCYKIFSDMGRNTFYSVVIASNSSSLKFKKKLNSKFIKLALYIELFKKFRWNFTLKTY